MRLQVSKAWDRARELCCQIEEVLPPKSEGVQEEYTDMEMPVLSLEEEDFCGLLTIPSYDRKLPVADTWDGKKVTAYPCRFYGTLYDGTLIIGGSDQEGQFDCLKWLENGSELIVTDMLGEEFTYTVREVERSKSAEAEVLTDETADLTLFVREAYSLEYIIIRCEGE